MIMPWRDVEIEPGFPSISTSLTAAETVRLGELAHGAVLEIGTAFGYSTIVMARTGAYVWAVDPHTHIADSREVLTRNLEAYGVADRVSPMYVPSQEILPHLVRDYFDLVFIDGDHAEDAVRFDNAWALELVRDGGVVAFHDYGEESCPGVKTALDDIYPNGPDVLTDSLFEVRL